MIALLAGQAGEGGTDSPQDAYKETLSATAATMAFPKKTSRDKGVMEGPCRWQVNSSALWMGNPEGEQNPPRAHRDFGEIYSMGPVFMPRTRKGDREVQGEQGLGRGRGVRGESAACQGTGLAGGPVPT